jgi:hypothetical protein
MAQIIESDATLVVDGAEYPVYARLSIYGDGQLSKGWSGFLGSNEGGLSWDFLTARYASLRLADGREGKIVATGVDDPDVGIGFKGSGPPPA